MFGNVGDFRGCKSVGVGGAVVLERAADRVSGVTFKFVSLCAFERTSRSAKTHDAHVDTAKKRTFTQTAQHASGSEHFLLFEGHLKHHDDVLGLLGFAHVLVRLDFLLGFTGLLLSVVLETLQLEVARGAAVVEKQLLLLFCDCLHRSAVFGDEYHQHRGVSDKALIVEELYGKVGGAFGEHGDNATLG